MAAIDDLLRRHFYDPARPGGLSSALALYRDAKKEDKRVTLKRVREWLADQDVYTLHAPIGPKKFPRSRTLGAGYHTHVQADLADMQKLRAYNDQYGYCLVAVDAYSRMLYAVPLKTKRGAEVAEAFRHIFTRLVPTHLCTDEGREFYNPEMRAYCAENQIAHYSTRSELKAALCERMIQTLKRRLYRWFTAKNTLRWIDVLDRVVAGINASVNKGIGQRPIDVRPNSFLHQYEAADRRAVRYRIGDTVRIAKYKRTFEKGYEPTFTDELFVVMSVHDKTTPPYYRLKALNDEVLEGRFYNEELRRATNTSSVYKIERVLQRRRFKDGERVLVKWWGYPASANSWIPASDLVDL